jgi:hypothetical protein
MVQHNMGRSWQSVVKEPFFDDFGLFGIIVVNFGKLLVVHGDLISFDEIVVEMNW